MGTNSCRISNSLCHLPYVKCQQVKLFGKHMAYIYDISDFEYQMIYSTLLTYSSNAGSALRFILLLGFETVEFG